MSGSQRILRLAARVAEARRPKRLDAATRLAAVPRPPGDSPAQTPAPLAAAPAPPTPAAPSERALPVSGEAARWLTHGEVPADLVPLAGDPTFPGEAATPPPAPTAVPAPAAESVPAPVRVRSSIVEGVREAPRAAPVPPPARPTATIVEELPGPGAHDGAPLMRLARVPQHDDRAQQLARAGSGELSDDGFGTSTVTFAAPGASASPTPAPQEAPRAPEPAAVEPAPLRLADVDVDALYEEFLRRLRRDLLHDRERLGDLLGPLR